MALTKPTTNTKTNAAAQTEEQLTEEGVQAAAAAEAAQEQEAEATTEQEQTAPEPEAAQKPKEVMEKEAEALAEAEPEAEVETSSSTEVAQHEEAKAPVKQERPKSSVARTMDEMEEEGMSGLVIDGMSFDQIRLPGEGQFLIGQDDVELGKEFDCIIQQTRARYVVRQSDDQDAEMFYSYDVGMCESKPKTMRDLMGVVDAEGNDRSETIEEWIEEGYDGMPTIRKYVEVMALYVDPSDEERHGMMVILSISPSSVKKFSGFLYQQRAMKKKKHNEFVTRCVVGTKVKNGNNSFFPWAFKNAGSLPEEFQDA